MAKKRSKKSSQDGATEQKSEDPKSRVKKLLNIADMDTELWHTPSGEAFATIFVDDHFEHHRIDGSGFSHFLCGEFFRLYGDAPRRGEIDEVIDTLKGRAIHQGEESDVFLRSAQVNDEIIIDLCNSDWEAVVVDKEGWQISKNYSARFYRTDSMLSLPRPVENGSIDKLKPFLNVSKEDWPLIACWIVCSLLPNGPFCVMLLSGEQGTAKTTSARVIRSLIDPNEAPVRSFPRTERDMMISAYSSWLMCLDNLSDIKQRDSDALCRLSTGGGFATRRLYKDREEVVLQAKRPILLTCISLKGIRSDLLDRSILLTLPVIPEEKRRTEQEFWNSFSKVSSQIMGGIFDAISSALKRYESIEVEELTRMADFVRWSMATEQGLGLKPGSFEESLRQNRLAVNMSLIEDSLVATTIVSLLSRREKYSTTANQLREILGRQLDDEQRKSGKWPGDARALSQEINRLEPSLRALGIVVERGHEDRDKQKRKVITLRKRNKA